MKSFKSFLTESSSPAASFDATKISLKDLIDCQRNAGYVISSSEAKMHLDSKFERYHVGAFVYVVMMEDDDEEEGGYYLARLHVSFNKEGKIVAEPSGMPFREGTKEEILAAFQKF